MFWLGLLFVIYIGYDLYVDTKLEALLKSMCDELDRLRKEVDGLTKDMDSVCDEMGVLHNTTTNSVKECEKVVNDAYKQFGQLYNKEANRRSEDDGK